MKIVDGNTLYIYIVWHKPSWFGFGFLLFWSSVCFFCCWFWTSHFKLTPMECIWPGIDQIFFLILNPTCELCKVNLAEFFTYKSFTAVNQRVFKPGKDTSQSQKHTSMQEFTKKNTLKKVSVVIVLKKISMSFWFCTSLKESIRECTSRQFFKMKKKRSWHKTLYKPE